MCIWSVFICLIIIVNGFGGVGKLKFYLNNWVLVTLIGSTTVSVFAIIKAIIAGIFKESLRDNTVAKNKD